MAKRVISIWLPKLLLILCLQGAMGSEGDQGFYFRRCVHDCTQRCADGNVSGLRSSTPVVDRTDLQRYPPWGISVVPWTCSQTCAYDCMTSISEELERRGARPVKYFGHWPFTRVLGLEEFASSIFSLGNIVPHVRFLLSAKPMKLSRSMWIDRTLVWKVTLYAIVAINAWVASSIYHAQKIPWTTAYDLSSALVLLVVGSSIAWHVLLMRLADGRRAYLTQRTLQRIDLLSDLALLVGLVLRLRRMLVLNDVSFQEHMDTCIGVAVLTTIFWLLWIFLPLLRFRRWKIDQIWCLLVQIWFVAASMLEIFDFPPVFSRLIDAHACWHAATIPLGFIWYLFWTSFLCEQRLEVTGTKVEN